MRTQTEARPRHSARAGVQHPSPTTRSLRYCRLKQQVQQAVQQGPAAAGVFGAAGGSATASPVKPPQDDQQPAQPQQQQQQYLRLPVESAKKLRWFDREDINMLMQVRRGLAGNAQPATVCSYCSCTNCVCCLPPSAHSLLPQQPHPLQPSLPFLAHSCTCARSTSCLRPTARCARCCGGGA